MNHLIVYVHPSSFSFCNAIMNTIKESSMRKQYKTEVRDLYSIGFDPILKSYDFEGARTGETPEDIKREQDYIKWANLITFIYPIWWTGMPAILKGYIDRVFSYNIIFDQDKGERKRLLQGKKILIFNSMGTSNEAYDKNGMINAMKDTLDIGIFKFCGIEVVQHKFFEAVPTVGPEKRKEYLDEVKQIFLDPPITH